MNYGERHHDLVKRLMRHVELSESQQSTIKGIVESSRESTKVAREQMHESHKAMREMATSDTYRIDQVRTLADQQAKFRAELTVARIDSMHRIQQVLTPEQRTKLMEQRAERKDRKDRKEERRDG